MLPPTRGFDLASVSALISAEMSSFKPVGGGFVRHATMWIDHSAGIVTGWVPSGLRFLTLVNSYPGGTSGTPWQSQCLQKYQLP